MAASGDRTDLSFSTDKNPRNQQRDGAARRIKRKLFELHKDQGYEWSKFKIITNEFRNAEVLYNGWGIVEIVPKFNDVAQIRWCDEGIDEIQMDRKTIEGPVLEAGQGNGGRFRKHKYEA